MKYFYGFIFFNFYTLIIFNAFLATTPYIFDSPISSLYSGNYSDFNPDIPLWNNHYFYRFIGNFLNTYVLCVLTKHYFNRKYICIISNAPSLLIQLFAFYSFSVWVGDAGVAYSFFGIEILNSYVFYFVQILIILVNLYIPISTDREELEGPVEEEIRDGSDLLLAENLKRLFWLFIPLWIYLTGIILNSSYFFGHMLVLVEHMYSLNILILVQDILLSILYTSPLYFWLRPFNKLADKNIGGPLSSFKLGIHLSVGILIALAVQIICYGTITYLFL